LSTCPKGEWIGAVDQQEAEGEDREREEVEVHVVADVDDAEERPARNRLDAVLAAGEGRLQREEVEHLRERQRHHGEVDALPPDRDRAGDEPHQPRASVRQPHTLTM
jgi:hypothetical protein